MRRVLGLVIVLPGDRDALTEHERWIGQAVAIPLESSDVGVRIAVLFDRAFANLCIAILELCSQRLLERLAVFLVRLLLLGE